MFHPGSRGDVEFKAVRRYNCPMCGFKTTIVPCVACLAKQAAAVPPETTLVAPAVPLLQGRGG